MNKQVSRIYGNAVKSDTIRVKKQTLRNIAIGIGCIAMLLVSYLIVNHYVIEEFQVRDKRISDLEKQVITLQGYLSSNGTELTELTLQISILTAEANTLASQNENLTNLTNSKQQQLSTAWASIQGKTGQVAELERILKLYQNPPTQTPYVK